MRALIAAGGTGGHIYPGIAVAKEIMRRDPQSTIQFVGTARGLETRLVPQAGFGLSLIESAGLVNMHLAARLRGLALLPKSFLHARRLIRSLRPDIVVGAGGYVTGSVLLTASLMRVPTLIMESNAVPGFTNRRLARFVGRAAVSFKEALAYFGDKGVLTGNPIRREFFDIPAKSRDDARFCLLIFGGSQGARAVNQAVVEALPRLESHKDALRIVHQTGERDYDAVREGYERAGWAGRADVRKYIDDMVAAFADADLIVSRAGATTAAELIAAGRAAVMVPLSGQTEQQKNAETLAAGGAARMILQAELSGEKLANEIGELISNPRRVTEMEQAARGLARGDAAAAVVDLIEEMVGQKRE